MHAPEGLELVKNVSEKFPVGTRVYIANPDKLYPKMSDVAKAMNLSRWTSGAKPIVPPVPKAVAAPAGENGDSENAENPPKKRKISRPLIGKNARLFKFRFIPELGVGARPTPSSHV